MQGLAQRQRGNRERSCQLTNAEPAACGLFIVVAKAVLRTSSLRKPCVCGLANNRFCAQMHAKTRVDFRNPTGTLAGPPSEMATEERRPPARPPEILGAQERCPICLNAATDPCLLQSCLHVFCLECIREWWRIRPDCPLCKRSSPCALRAVRSDKDYEKVFLSAEMSHAHRWWTRGHQIRRAVYARGLLREPTPQTAATSSSDVESGRARRRRASRQSMSARDMALLRAWAERELQSALEVEDVKVVVEVAASLASAHGPNTAALAHGMREYTLDYTDIFSAEFAVFLRSPCSLSSFDLRAKYRGIGKLSTQDERKDKPSPRTALDVNNCQRSVVRRRQPFETVSDRSHALPMFDIPSPEYSDDEGSDGEGLGRETSAVVAAGKRKGGPVKPGPADKRPRMAFDAKK